MPFFTSSRIFVQIFKSGSPLTIPPRTFKGPYSGFPNIAKVHLEEVHMYNRMTGCSLELDFFTFDPWVQAMEEFLPLPDHVQLADISHGEERMPISASNCHDSTYPPYINYRTVPIPQKGVSINEDKGFLTGCDCTDDCTNKGLCSCWQLTIQSTRFANISNIPLNPPCTFIMSKV